jgi:integrase
MASITKRPDGQWRARYRDSVGKEHARHFGRKIDAQQWLDTVTTAVQTGMYVDPGLGRITVGEWAQKWIDGQAHLKPSTAERYRGILAVHVLPRWGTVRLADVAHSDVQSWVSTLGLSSAPATVRKTFRVLSLILALAVKDGRLARNPAAGVNLPRVATPERRFLTHGQVQALADAAGEYRLVVLMLAYTGVRFGELAALRVKRIDLMRRRALVAESVTEVGGVQQWGTPKGHERREVPIPRFLVDDLAVHVAGRHANDLVFPGVRAGNALRVRVFRRAALDRAAAALGLEGLHPHELRHTAASLAIASGANVKVVQQMLGHKSAVMTLDLYGHLFGDQLDDVADRMDAAARTARGLLADQVRTSGGLLLMPHSAATA